MGECVAQSTETVLLKIILNEVLACLCRIAKIMTFYFK